MNPRTLDDSEADHPRARLPEPAKLRRARIPVVLASFVVGGSAAFVVFFAHPFSDSFWRRFGEFWGFLWFWERGTLSAIVWGAFVGAALLVHRPLVGDVAVPRLALIGSISGFLTSAIVVELAHLFGFSPATWLGLGAAIGVAINVGLFSWIGSRSSVTLGAHTNSKTH